jgi:hypothetical protein
VVIDWIRLVGPTQTVEIGGVKLVGVNAENGTKLIVTLALIVLVLLLGRLLRIAIDWLLRHRRNERMVFWIRQSIRLFTAALLLLGLVSIWFDDPTRLATALGLVTAVFDEPVYNYSRDFPYVWEEMQLPIPYSADRERAERILLETAKRHTVLMADLSAEILAELERRYFMKPADVKPRVYYRLTDNWLELTVRFIARDHGVRELKDVLSRDILRALDEAGIGVASSTLEVVGLPPLRIAADRRDKKAPPA